MGECFFLVLTHPGTPRQRAVKHVCVCVIDRLIDFGEEMHGV